VVFNLPLHVWIIVCRTVRRSGLIVFLGSIPGRSWELFSSPPRPERLWGPQPPIQWVPGCLSLGVKRPWLEVDHSLPSSAEFKECMELYLHSPNTPSRRGAQLKHRDNFTFYLYEQD
jgi:hypothetical protein